MEDLAVSYWYTAVDVLKESVKYIVGFAVVCIVLGVFNDKSPNR